MPNVEEEKQPWLRPELVASWREIAAVIVVLVAPFALPSSQAAWHTLSRRRLVSSFMSDRGMLDNAAFEASLLGVLLVYLQWRGWKRADLRISPSLWGSVQGILLAPIQWIASLAAYLGVGLIFYCFLGKATFMEFAISPRSISHTPVHHSWIIYLCTGGVLNAFFEEITFLSYAFNQLAMKRGPRFAMVMTLLLRMSCHTYHGPIYIWGTMATFMVATFWYWRTRNVWPIIVGHALFDIGLDLNIFSWRLLFHLFGR